MRKNLLILLFALAAATTAAHGQINKLYYVWMSQDMLLEHRNKEAIETLNILLRADPEAYEGYFWRAIAKYELGDVLGAEKDFTKAIDINPVYTYAYLYRGITRSLLGNYEDALADFDETIDLRPDRAEPYFRRGTTYLIGHDYEKAVADFDRYIIIDNRYADAYLNRGHAYLGLKDTVSAMDNFTQAIRTNREYARSYFERGTLHMQLRQTDDALADFNKAIELSPENMGAYFNRGLVNMNADNLMEALADFEKAAEINPAYAGAYFNMAVIRTEIGDLNRALVDYDRLTKYAPDNVLVYYNRGNLNARLGNLQAAVKDYDRAIEIYPDFANAYLNRANVKYLLRDERGSRRDKETGELKIAEYRSRLKDSTYQAYADTTMFRRLVSFDANYTENARRATAAKDQTEISLRPLYKFTLARPSTDPNARAEAAEYPRAMDFLAALDESMIALTNSANTIPADSIMMFDTRFASAPAKKGRQAEAHFRRGITLSLSMQFTNSVNSYSSAIEIDPSNPFLYFNRGAAQAEMVDFISSMDNSFISSTSLSDLMNRGNGGGNLTRTYSYDEAIADLNKAAKLYPEFPYIYYNRANLQALSGMFPEAFEDYSRAIELNPAFADAYFNRGLVQIFMKDTRKGCLDISKAGELGIKEAYDVLKLYSNFSD